MMRPETRALIQYLRDCHASKKLASYSDMSKMIHADVQFKERNCLSTALDIVHREHNAVFVCVPGQGYKPASNRDIADKCSDRKRQIKNIAMRWRNELECVNVAALSQDELLQYVQKGFELKFVEAAVSDTAEQKIAQKVKESLNPLDCYKNVDVMALLGSVS